MTAVIGEIRPGNEIVLHETRGVLLPQVGQRITVNDIPGTVLAVELKPLALVETRVRLDP